jgi:hypothetical protein
MTFENEATAKLNRYITGTDHVFASMEVSYPTDMLLKKRFEEALALSRQYLEDSKYYLGRKDLVTSLVCIAYCEGIIDACRKLGWLKYRWEDEPDDASDGKPLSLGDGRDER